MHPVHAAAAAMLLLSLSAPAGAEGTAIQSITNARVQECGTFAELYLRLTDLRDLGADESVAVNRGVEFLGGVGRTGSHLAGKNYRPAVEKFARFVYTNKGLRREALYMRGLYSCVLSKVVKDDALYTKAQNAFDRDLGRCQSAHSDPAAVSELGDCVSAAAETIAQKAQASKSK